MKSGYHMAKSICASTSQHGNVRESSSGANNWARNIWKLNVSNKIKHFIWWIWTNSLSTRLNCFNRKACPSPFARYVYLKMNLLCMQLGVCIKYG